MKRPGLGEDFSTGSMIKSSGGIEQRSTKYSGMIRMAKDLNLQVHIRI